MWFLSDHTHFTRCQQSVYYFRESCEVTHKILEKNVVTVMSNVVYASQPYIIILDNLSHQNINIILLVEQWEDV